MPTARKILVLVTLGALALWSSACGGGDDAGPGGVAAPADGGDARLRPRNLPVKPTHTVLGPNDTSHLIFLKFMDDSGIRCRDGQPVIADAGQYPGLTEALDLVRGATWEAGHPIGEDRLDELRDNAQRALGRAVADLCVQFILLLPAGVSSEAACDAFNASPIVELAWPVTEGVPDPLPGDFTAMQGYLDEATDGIGAERAWAECPVRGAGVRVCDLERDWNANHQDLPPVTLLGNPGVDPDGTPVDDNRHGTAVMGEMASLDNGFGTTGACPDSDFFFVAVRTLVMGVAVYDVAGAITTSLGTLGAGDVLLIEQQIAGPNWPGGMTQMGLVATEWDVNTYNAIVMAVGNGVTVVEAAGNGSEDLDDPVYNVGHAPFVPANDSGAIIVGAGAAPAAFGGSDTDRSRLGFSNYGATVDLQGWGERVTTLAYGDLYNLEGVNLQYTATFGGTSSASPIVAAACALLQSAEIARTGTPLTPAEVKARLQATGSPQQAGVNPVSENIGPRPDALAAIGCLEITCPPDDTQECTSPMGTMMTYPITVSDPGGGGIDLTIRVNGSLEDVVFFPASGPPSGGTHMFTFTYPLGVNTVEATAAGGGAVAPCTFTVTVEDTMDPVLMNCPGDMTVECDSPMGAIVNYTAPTAFDACDANVTVTCVPASGTNFPFGPTVVTCTALDDAGNDTDCMFTVTVEDTTPPVVNARAQRSMMFLPRNGLLDSLLVRTAMDVCDPTLDYEVEVWSDQPDPAGPYNPDAQVVGAVDAALQLRAEVDLALAGPGRVYLVIVTAEDDAGNVGRDCTWVVVPKTATVTDLIGTRNVAIAAENDCDMNGMTPAGWTQILAPTALPTP